MRRPCLHLAAILLTLGLRPALASAPVAGPAVPDTLEQRLLACASCHARVDSRGQPVNDSFFPRLAGKPADYLYNQLVNFRDGRRRYPLMNYLVAYMPDAYLKEIAQHFSRQPVIHLPATVDRGDSAQLARGRALVMQGDAARGLPACIACHGQRLTGVAPAIPGLLGLPPDYVNAQFGAWRNQVRQSRAPDCMAAISNKLAANEVAAISAWLASQPMPSSPAPASASELKRPLPIACGSSPEGA